MPPPANPTGAAEITSIINEKQSLLERVGDALGIDDFSFPSYASAIMRISARDQDAILSLMRLTLVERQLQAHLAAMRHEERLTESWIVQRERGAESDASTAALENKREVLLRKAKEERATLESRKINPPAVTFSDLMAQQATNSQRTEAIKAKRAQLKAFKGLPPNLDLARRQLESARAAQMELIQTRERLLARMAESVV